MTTTDHNALHFSCDREHDEVTEELLQRYPDLANQTGPANRTPLFTLLSLEQIPKKIFQAFLKAGAKLDHPDWTGETPLHLLALHKRTADCLKEVEDKPPRYLNWNPQICGYGTTPLDVAMKRGNQKAVEILRKHAVLPDITHKPLSQRLKEYDREQNGCCAIL